MTHEGDLKALKAYRDVLKRYRAFDARLAQVLTHEALGFAEYVPDCLSNDLLAQAVACYYGNADVPGLDRVTWIGQAPEIPENEWQILRAIPGKLPEDGDMPQGSVSEIRWYLLQLTGETPERAKMGRSQPSMDNPGSTEEIQGKPRPTDEPKKNPGQTDVLHPSSKTPDIRSKAFYELSRLVNSEDDLNSLEGYFEDFTGELWIWLRLSEKYGKLK